MIGQFKMGKICGQKNNVWNPLLTIGSEVKMKASVLQAMCPHQNGQIRICPNWFARRK